MARPLLVAGACIAAGFASLVFPWAPDYDPLAWLVWGREIAAGELDTTSGPAWKPLPVVLTTALAAIGDTAPAVWVALARAAWLLAVVLAFVVAARLERGRLAVLGGAVGAAALATTPGFASGAAVGNSEALLIALILLGVERHVAGRPRHAAVAGIAAALLRPEIWPFLALYAAALWRREGAWRARIALVAALALVPALWFLPELWGSGDLLRSSDRARVPNPGAPALADRPALEVVERFATLVSPLVVVLGVVALAIALRRRDRVLAALAVGGAAWVAFVALMSEAGYSGEERYLFPAAAVAAVLAGVGAASLARLAAERGLPRTATAVGVVTVALAVALPAVPEAREAAREVAYAAEMQRDLRTVVDRAGGAVRLRRCGSVYAGRYRFPAVAWRLRIHIADVSLRPATSGTILRSRLRRESVPSPDIPPGSAYRTVARAGAWEVLATC
jgi:hypothetical protein